MNALVSAVEVSLSAIIEELATVTVQGQSVKSVSKPYSSNKLTSPVEYTVSSNGPTVK